MKAKKAIERRKEIINALMSEQRPISGGEFAERLNVSRQIIVQDISLLKAAGYEIISTHYGYLLHSTPLFEKALKVKHTQDETEDELNTIVDMGGTVVDVFVRHKVYGKVEAKLNIFSRHQVKQFIEGVRTGKSTELMGITGGYHYHTVRAENKETLESIEQALKDKNYLVTEE